MKLSVSLSPHDVAFLDHYAQEQGGASRSAVIQRALALLRTSELGPAYTQAWDEWEDTADAQLWDAVVGDGLTTRQDR